jgi:hypothetical protein
MRRAALLTLTAALLAAQPAAAADRCKVPRGSSTVAKTSRVHVYFEFQPVRGPESAAYACNRRTGRRFKLDDPRREIALSTGQIGDAPEIERYQLLYTTVQHDGAEDVYLRLRTLDLATGKKRALGFYVEGAEELVVDAHILASGVVAWHEVVDEMGPVSKVWLSGAAGKQLLDSAREAQGGGITDLAVGGTSRDPLLYWMNGATPRGAPMR